MTAVAAFTSPTDIDDRLNAWRKQLDCAFTQIDAIFAACMAEASTTLSEDGLIDFLAQARFLGKMGRGPEPVLTFLQEWPPIARTVGEDALSPVMVTVRLINKSPNGNAIAPFLQTLAAVARRLPTQAQLQHYMDLCLLLLERTSGSIHGIHKTYPSPSLPIFFEKAPLLLGALSLQGLSNWMNYGIRNYSHHPEQQRDFFSMHSADSRAVLQRERHGTLLMDHTRGLDLYLKALWQDGDRAGALLHDL
jgi:nitric oxide reductase NorD protein